MLGISPGSLGHKEFIGYPRRHVVQKDLIKVAKKNSHHRMSMSINIEPSGQITIIPKPELRGFWGSSLIKPPFRVTSAEVVIICPEPSQIWNLQVSSSRDLPIRIKRHFYNPYHPCMVYLPTFGCF